MALFQSPFEDKRVSIDPTMGLVVKGDLTDGDYTLAAHWLQAGNVRLKAMKTAYDRFLGQLILHYSATRDCTWSDAISRLNLVAETSKAFKSLVKLPRIVSLLPDEAFNMPNINTTILDAVCSYAPPEEPDKALSFNEGRMQILKDASDNPDDVTISKINQRMRALQSEHGVKPSRKTPLENLKHDFIMSSLMLINWHDDDYSAFGVTKDQTLGHWEGHRSELVERGYLRESEMDPGCVTLPWKSMKVIEGEIVEEEL